MKSRSDPSENGSGAGGPIQGLYGRNTILHATLRASADRRGPIRTALPTGIIAVGMSAISLLQRFLLPAILGGVGGIAGLFVGGAAVPAGSGLAGPAIVLGYGAVGAVCGLVAGAIAAWLLPARHVRPALFAALGLGLIAAAAVGIRVVRTNRERAERAGVEQQQREATFFAAAIADGPHDGSSFVDIRVDGEHDAFVMTARGQPESPTCRGTIDDEDRARLLRVLRNAEDLLERDPDPCAGTGEPYRRFRWSLPERGGAEREVALTIACGQEHSELVALYVPFESIAFRATRGRGDVACEEAQPPSH